MEINLWLAFPLHPTSYGKAIFYKCPAQGAKNTVPFPG
jgi:hypothetical protein